MNAHVVTSLPYVTVITMSDAHVHTHTACITHSALQQDEHRGGTAMHLEPRGCAICTEICMKRLHFSHSSHSAGER